MEALNAVGLTPISVLSEKRTKPRKIFSLPTTIPLKFPISANSNTNPPHFPQRFSRNFPGGLVFLSTILNTGLARALTYEEALKQLVSTSDGISDFDPSGVLDSVVNFGVDKPAVAVGGATTAVVVVSLVLSQILSKFKPFGVESAKSAFAKLGEDVSSQLLDIREKVDLRQVGSPDIRGLKKKPVSIVYKEKDKTVFLKKLGLKFKEPESTTLFILDKFDGKSEEVTELVTANGFKAAYAIKDGAEGPRGWLNSGLPWLLPKKALDFSDLADAIGGALGEDSDALPVVLGFAAASGLGLLAFSEVETVLQLLGSAALVQFISKKLLFAEDRKQTLQQIDEFLNTKVAPKELADEIKEIGKAILPSSVTSNSLPAPAEANLVVTENHVQKAEAAVADPTPQINSVPKTEVKAESVTQISRPLSPYPYYPDYKPPTSPTPSQP